MAYLNPKDIVVDFLRKNIADPRDRVTSGSDSFTATAAQTTFTLTPSTGKKLCYIDSITVDGTPVTKWRDYYINFKEKQIIFFSGQTLNAAVEVSYGETTKNWIYPGKANKKLNAESFPRMNLLIVGSPGSRLGNYEAPVEAIPRFQMDVWTKEKQDNQIFTIDGSKYTGEDLGKYLAYQITKAFEENEKELFPALYGYDPVGMPPDLPFDEELQCHHTVAEFILRGLDLGRVN